MVLGFWVCVLSVLEFEPLDLNLVGVLCTWFSLWVGMVRNLVFGVCVLPFEWEFGSLFCISCRVALKMRCVFFWVVDLFNG